MIQINVLAHSSDRFTFTSKALDFLKEIKNENKKKIQIVIVATDGIQRWIEKVQEINQHGIDCNLLTIPNSYDNYLLKIKSICETKCEYSCSMDDDILISNYLWDYIIENIDILKDDSNLFLAPLISNGIPSVDFFIEDFFEEDSKKEIKDIFIRTKIDNYWGVDYSCLNKHREEWNTNYYEDVKKINHYYKGIHPVRISVDAHKKIAENICSNYKRMILPNDYKIEKHQLPYFCNSFYFIKTSTWKKIIHDESLFRDPFDEVPLNLYKDSNNLNMLFIRNGFCLHMAYNTIGTTHQKKIEEYYIENFIKNV